MLKNKSLLTTSMSICEIQNLQVLPRPTESPIQSNIISALFSHYPFSGSLHLFWVFSTLCTVSVQIQFFCLCDGIDMVPFFIHSFHDFIRFFPTDSFHSSLCPCFTSIHHNVPDECRNFLIFLVDHLYCHLLIKNGRDAVFHM